MKRTFDCVEFCKALSDPTRQQILEMLLEKEMSVDNRALAVYLIISASVGLVTNLGQAKES